MDAFEQLVRSVHAALEVYSNVHRGSGHKSAMSTRLFEQSRQVVLEYLGLDKRQYTVIYCTPRRAEMLKARLRKGSYTVVSSEDIGLPLGVRAVVVARKALPGGAPFQTGGGTARLVFPNAVIWAGTPDRFEPGTPAVINIVAFAVALQLIGQHAHDFAIPPAAKRTSAEILYCDDLGSSVGRELLDKLRESRIGRDLRVPTLEGERQFINLDNAASTPTFASIWDVVWQTWLQPEGVQRQIIRDVQGIVATMIGAPQTAYDVIFTANTTEGINLVAENLRLENDPGVEPIILNTLLEHNSNELPWRRLPGYSLLRLGVDSDGLMDLNELERLLSAYNSLGRHGKQRIKLVAVSGASNVLGVCTPLAQIGKIAHRYGANLLVDAAQLIAHRKVEMENWGIDYLVFSAHKAYAPFGSGALVVRKGLLHFSQAELEVIQASGEENAGGIAAMGKAMLLLERIGIELIQSEEQKLTRHALRGLAQIPGIEIYGKRDPDLPGLAHRVGVISFNLKRPMADSVSKELARRGGIGVRSGCHCAHLLVKHILRTHPLLTLLQGLVVLVAPQALPGVARVSLGIENSVEEINTLIRSLEDIACHPTSQTGEGKAAKVRMDAAVLAAGQRVYGRI